MPLTQTIRGSLLRARVLGGFLRNSFVFKLKRQALRPRYWFNRVSLIVVDMDGTLFDADAGNVGLRMLYPDMIDRARMGDILYEGMLHKLSQGTSTVEETILDGNRLLQYRNFKRSDLKKVLNLIWPTLRKEFVSALNDIRREKDVTIILATLSSSEFANLVNKRLRREMGFEFDGVIGTTLSFDKKEKMTGVKEILGLKNGKTRGVKVRTKLKAIKEWCKKHALPFSMNQTVLITDSYGDIDMAKHVKTILLVPEKPSTVQKISKQFRLADKLIPADSHLRKNIHAIFSAMK